MATQIANSTNSITITTGGVVYWTLPKRLALEIKDGTLKFHYYGEHIASVEFSDVSSPSTANIEALRTAVNAFLIS